MAEFGLWLFVFVSGFSLQLRYGQICTSDGVKSFFKKRIIRIYPLYIVAVVSYLLAFETFAVYTSTVYPQINPSSADIIITIFGGQILLAPRFTTPFALWFVGLILMYYLLYPALSFFSSNYRTLLLVAFALLACCIAIRLVFDVIEERFFLWYGVFVAGIVAAQLNLLGCNSNRRVVFAHLVGLFFITTVPIFVHLEIARPNYYNYSSYALLLNNTALTVYVLAVLLSVSALSFVFLTFCATRALNGASANQSKWGSAASALVVLLAYSAYAIYLFHVQILSLVAAATVNSLGAGGAPAELLIVVAFGLPAVLAVSYVLQRTYDVVIARLKEGSFFLGDRES